MERKLLLLLTTFLIPSALWAHGEQVLYILGTTFFVSLIISFIMLMLIRKRITVNNKLAKFVVLFLIEIALFSVLCIAVYWVYVLFYILLL